MEGPSGHVGVVVTEVGIITDGLMNDMPLEPLPQHFNKGRLSNTQVSSDNNNGTVHVSIPMLPYKG